MEPILKSTASILISYTVHYVATKAYSYACVPDGLMGYLAGLITTGSPVCQAGVHIISNTQVSYSSMVLMGISRLFVDLVTPGAPVAHDPKVV